MEPIPSAEVERLKAAAARLRGRVIEMSHAASSAHLASSLSCCDIVAAAYWGVCQIDPARPDDPLRDRFILSKGHAATALYAALAFRGFFPEALLETYCQDGGMLAEHPPARMLPICAESRSKHWTKQTRFAHFLISDRLRTSPNESCREVYEDHRNSLIWIKLSGS